MAQKVSVQLVDDVDGSVADSTVEFALDGVSYQIDLSHENATELRDALDPFLSNARRTGGRKKQRAKQPGSTTRPAAGAQTRRRNQAIREWAREQGLQVSDRGRIPADIVQQYDNATA